MELFAGLERRVVAHAKAAETLSLADAKQEALEASSGALSTAELRRRDHPYARRHGSATEDPQILNSQSGDFRRAWRASAVTRRVGKLTGTVRNTDRKAKYMRGTEKMLPRPVAARVITRVRRIRRYRLKRALWSGIVSRS